MRILFVGKTDRTGGAAITSHRLYHALKQYTPLALKFLVQEKQTSDKSIYATGSHHAMQFLRFAWERLAFLPHEASKEIRFKFSIANTGEDITRHPLFRQADLIHLHWFNQGFLSLHGLEKIFQYDKPVVWTLHDHWAFTGGCHNIRGCNHFIAQCGNCPLLKKPAINDLSARLFRQKQAIYAKSKSLTMVTCSKWQEEQALSSSLLKGIPIKRVGHTLDFSVFRKLPENNNYIAGKLPYDKKFLLFGAANATDKSKGIQQLTDALNILEYEHHLSEKVELIVFGKMKYNPFSSSSYKIHYFNYINEESVLTQLYNAADVYITPSLEETFGLTILEAMACETPVVAFNHSGPKDMVVHKQNGYLATYQDATDFAQGIYWTLFEADTQTLGSNARLKAIKDFHPQKIAQAYYDIYQNAYPF